MSEKIIIKNRDPHIQLIKGVDNFGLLREATFIAKGITASDGYHTFEELYDHQITLFIALCKSIKNLGAQPPYSPEIWRSKVNGDGTAWDGWFVMGIGKEIGKQITYHLPLSRWEEADFAETLEQAPEFDGHTSNDVLERLKNL